MDLELISYLIETIRNDNSPNDRSCSGGSRYELGHGECLLQPRGDHFYQEERGDHQRHF